MDQIKPKSQRQLLIDARFYPLFWTQFGGAFNDNLYKSALMMLFTYSGLTLWGQGVDVLNNVVAAALIIPFLLFAPVAGQFADRLDKAAMARVLKLAEIGIMSLGAVAFWLQSPALLLLVVLGTGIQSACFSPVKYAILPQQVNSAELTGANGVLHTGTSLAVFCGLIVGTLAMQFSLGAYLVATIGLLISLAGWLLSRRIAPAPPAPNAPEYVLNPFRQILRSFSYLRRNRLVFSSVLAFSWYWYLGSVYLTQLPNFSRELIHGEGSVVTALLVTFLLGVCSGALACNRISRGQVEPAIVPLGGLLVLVFGVDLALAGQAFAAGRESLAEPLYALSYLLTQPEFWRILIDVLFLGVAGGLYSVPLQAIMQRESASEYRAQIIGANNVVNALFMMAASVSAIVFLGTFNFTIPHFFLLIAAVHSVIIVLLLVLEPVFLQRVRQRILS
ncbi:MFS transporter [Gilvimarinus sp. DA14]|uniref:MFS transporter n=1 Tax=Gilvimarinus sp. DA14 TaxID=2956798 RepID=UPI0020B65D7B|nr:MFS transporter [Gilvimarinus sp. DA14]UTF59967.1 MFS transporter [Gilvimarinus sp. DA14]